MASEEERNKQRRTQNNLNLLPQQLSKATMQQKHRNVVQSDKSVII